MKVFDLRRFGGRLLILGKALILPSDTTPDEIGVRGSLRYNDAADKVEALYANGWTVLGGGEGGSSTKGISAFVSGTPGSYAVVGGVISPYDFTFSETSSKARCLAGALSDAEFSIRKNNEEIGTIFFPAGDLDGVVSFYDASVLKNDLITIHAQAIADEGISDIIILLTE